MAEEREFNSKHLCQLAARDGQAAKEYIHKFFYYSGSEIFVYSSRKGFESMDAAAAIKLIPENATIDHRKARKYLETDDFTHISYEPITDFRVNERTLTRQRVDYERGQPVTMTDHFVNCVWPMAPNITRRTVPACAPQLQMILDHIRDVLCGGDEVVYEYVLNFIACTLNGRKLRKALYMQSPERTGKGTLVKLLTAILGERAYKTSSVENVIKFTKPLEGRCLVNLDEMPMDGGSFRTISDHLKSLITEDKFTCRAMYQQSYTQDNHFNIIITTNNDAITLTQSNNSRYVVLDVSTERVGDTDYFTKLNRAIADNDVICSFYDLMMRRYETLGDWNEDIAPSTKSKEKKMIEALPRFVKWIKERYVLPAIDMDIETKVLFDAFAQETGDKSSKQKLGKYINELGIQTFRKGTGENRTYRFIKSHLDLQRSYRAKNWIDDDVDYCAVDVRELETDVENDAPISCDDLLDEILGNEPQNGAGAPFCTATAMARMISQTLQM